MISIFHGEDQQESRSAFNKFLEQQAGIEVLRLDHKEATFDLVNSFVNGQSLFSEKKLLASTNFFSISKPVLEKILKVLKDTPVDLAIWQDKALTVTQLKTFPQAQVQIFKQSNPLWPCLNSLQPKNSKKFFPLYHQIIDDNYDLFLYLVRQQIRKQLLGASRFSPVQLKKAYLLLIDLDYANKSGQLSIPGPIALERILLDLMEH